MRSGLRLKRENYLLFGGDGTHKMLVPAHAMKLALVYDARLPAARRGATSVKEMAPTTGSV